MFKMISSALKQIFSLFTFSLRLGPENYTVFRITVSELHEYTRTFLYFSFYFNSNHIPYIKGFLIVDINTVSFPISFSQSVNN